MARQYDGIDLLKLQATQNSTTWNHWLTSCLINERVQELVKTRYGLQVGYDDLVKKKLNTPKTEELFLRWTKSIETTLKRIWRKQNPNPHYADVTLGS